MKRKMNVPSSPVDPAAERRSRDRTCDDATFPSSSPMAEVPDGYGATLADINERVLTQRLRVVVAAANAAIVELHWDIGCAILEVPVRRMGVHRCT